MCSIQWNLFNIWLRELWDYNTQCASINIIHHKQITLFQRHKFSHIFKVQSYRTLERRAGQFWKKMTSVYRFFHKWCTCGMISHRQWVIIFNNLSSTVKNFLGILPWFWCDHAGNFSSEYILKVLVLLVHTALPFWDSLLSLPSMVRPHTFKLHAIQHFTLYWYYSPTESQRLRTDLL